MCLSIYLSIYHLQRERKTVIMYPGSYPEPWLPLCMTPVLSSEPQCRFSFLKFYLSIYFVVLGLSCSMWDQVPQLKIEPRPPALGVMS